MTEIVISHESETQTRVFGKGWWWLRGLVE